MFNFGFNRSLHLKSELFFIDIGLKMPDIKKIRHPTSDIRHQKNMPLQFNPVKLFAGSGTTVLAGKIARQYGRDLGDVTISRFSDGEFQPHFNESVRGCEVFLIQSTNPPTDILMELVMMTDAPRRPSAQRS